MESATPPDAVIRPNRRRMLTGMAAIAAIPRAQAEQSSSPIAHGVLANNPLAQAFERAPSQLPSIALLGLDGDHNTAEFRGRTTLMPLWAEWCQPCLGELPDFSRLQQKFGGSNFQIMPVLTGARKQVTPQIIAQLFNFLHATALTPLMEKGLTNHLMNALAARGRNIEIPCNVLIGPDGDVIAREFGLKSGSEDGSIPAAADGSPQSLVARAESGESLSLWGKAEGEQFATAMANGFLSNKA